MFKLTIRTIPLLFLLFWLHVKPASAQGMSAYFGLGTATDSAATSPGCAPHFILDELQPTPTCEPAPTMGGVFGVIGVDFMITQHFGVNVQDAFRFAQASYLPAVGIKARPTFYDFNAIYHPFSAGKRIVPILEGGIGGSKVSLYFTQQTCATVSVCSTQSGFFASANHFQVHGAFGVKLYVTPSVFIKPQVDAHWVRNMNQQYGRNFVPQYTVAVGYTFGER